MLPETMIGQLKATLRTGRAVRGAPLWRLRLASLFDRLDLRLPGLGPSAILVTRRVVFSGPISATRGRFEDTAEYERAVRSRLSALARGAARPQRGRLPQSAQAILFTDLGELLACLLLAWQRGEGLHAWWWRYLVPRLHAGGFNQVEQVLLAQVRYLPSAWNYLASWNHTETAAAALPGETVRFTLAALIAAFALPAYDWAESANSTPHPASELPPGISRSRVAPQVPGAPSFRPPLPWKKWLPAGIVPVALPAEKQLLLALCLLLHRRPHIPRRPDFNRDVALWWSAQIAGQFTKEASTPYMAESPQETAETAGGIVNRLQADGSTMEPEAFSATATETVLEKNAQRGKAPSGPAETQQTALPLHAPAEQPVAFGDLPAHAARPLDPVRPDPSVKMGATVAGKIAASETLISSQHPARDPPPTTKAPPAEPITTRLGGIFYLVNVMEFLDIPEAFEEQWALASQLSRWELLDLLGRACLGPEGKEILLARDALWMALAAVDERQPHTLPGEDFVASATSLPRSWRARFAGKARWRLQEAPLLNGLSSDLARWLEHVMPLLQWRLCGMLGTDSLARTLLLAPARLYMTSSHLDLVMPLDAISLPARLAGLDRNPGWLPAWGRVITFHYRDEP